MDFHDFFRVRELIQATILRELSVYVEKPKSEDTGRFIMVDLNDEGLNFGVCFKWPKFWSLKSKWIILNWELVIGCIISIILVT